MQKESRLGNENVPLRVALRWLSAGQMGRNELIHQ